VELLETVLGCAWLGAVVVPLNTALRGAGLLHTLTDSGARALLVEPALAPVLDDLPLPDCLQEVWLLDEEEPERVSKSSRGASQVRLLPYPRSEVTREPHRAAPGDTLAILYTSGTTGLPKGVLCPHAQFYWWGISVGECLELGPDDVLFTTLPLFHTNALNAFFQAAVAGSTFVLERRFSASRFWSQATECGATVTYLLGAMVQILLTRPGLDSDRQHRVRAALSPATPVHASVEFEERFGVTLVEGYGSTETNLVLAASLSHQRPGLMGVPLADFEARVVDAGGLDVPDGTPGELICRSRRPYAFATGYHCNPQATAESWKDLWFHTGDQVIRHEDGWYQFVDRIKDSIRRRGENISSLEVELVVGGHPAVEAVAVYAVPSELAEDEVMAAITVRPDVSLDPQDLVTWCEPRLAYFAIPRFVEILDQLPLTENGKIRKAALRERGVTSSTWDRESLSPRRARSSH
jgi:crotonobetaine/carnitine-CoA ligase